mgnify:FL=1
MAKKRQYKTKKSQDSQPHGAFLQICEPMFCGGKKNHTQGKFQRLKKQCNTVYKQRADFWELPIIR